MIRQAVPPLLLALLLFCFLSVSPVRAVKLTSSDASCILEAVASSGYQEGLVPMLRAKLFIHGTATFGITELEADVAWGAFNITNISNGYKFFPRRATTTKATTGSTLTTFTFPFTEYSTQAGDIEISYSELPFQPSELMVNTTVHVTSFTIACTNTVKPYLYNAHMFGTVAEFLFTEPVVRCDNRSNETLSKDWLVYSNRACDAGADADDTGCVKTYPKTISLCATDLKPVGGNSRRWWCTHHGNMTNGWSLETYFVQYYLRSGVVCSAAGNTTVTTFTTTGVKVFRQQESAILIHPVLAFDTTDVGRSNPGIQFIDIQFQFPVDAPYISRIAPVARFDYASNTKTARCNYYSDAGFTDGQILRYKCSPAIQLQLGETPNVAIVGTATSRIVYHLLNYSATAGLGVDFVNYSSTISPTTEVDGEPGVAWSAIVPTVEWIQALYYVNTTALKFVPTQAPTSLPKRGNIICYDTQLGGRYDITSTSRTGDTVYLTFSADEPLPAFAADSIYCYFLFMTPDADVGYGVYPANAIPITLEPDNQSTEAKDDSVFASLGAGGSIVVLIVLCFFAFIGFVFAFLFCWQVRKARKGGDKNPYRRVGGKVADALAE